MFIRISRYLSNTLATSARNITRAFKTWEVIFVTGLSCLMALLYVLNVPLFEHIELKCWDLHFSFRGPIETSGPVAFVAIDEDSVNREGRWPWPRRTMARLLKAVDDSGALIIGQDFGYFEPDPKLRKQAILDLTDRLSAGDQSFPSDIITIMNKIAEGEDDDILLADTIKELSAPLVLGHFFYSEGSTFVPAPPLPWVLDKAACPVVVSRKTPPRGKLLEQAGMESNIPIVAEVTRYSGSFNMVPDPDPDGSIRRMPLLFRYQGRMFPSLALQMLAAALPDQPFIVKLDEGGVEGIRLGPVSIPTNSTGELLTNFYGPKFSFPHYSASAVLRGEIPPDSLKDKIVVIGITTMGLHDMRPTPVDPVFPGVELHCTVLLNILQEQFLRHPNPIYDLGAILGLALLFLFVQHFLRGAVLAGVVVTLLGGYMFLTHYLFTSGGLWLNHVYPSLNFAFAYVGTTVHRYVKEEREKRRYRETFSLYVPPSVVEEMLENPEKLHLGGEKKELSILFSDIRGFTSLSEKFPAEDLVPQLNHYLTRMTEVVFQQQGTLDKFIGDAVMALFGVPLPQEDHPIRACNTALSMVRELRVLKDEWRSRKLPVLDIGVGINTGVAMVGNMGSERRLDYTAIGDNVNLASRLEGLTSKYGVRIIISESVWKEAHQEFVARELDLVQVKGKKQPVRVYQLVCKRGEDAKFAEPLEIFSEALALYRDREWAAAHQRFALLDRLWPGDRPSHLYLTRCKDLLANDPGDD
ncbi:MAG: adenylate/guanylate cyclase domain-containing protein, partial [Syntrophobacteraceae bacterium]